MRRIASLLLPVVLVSSTVVLGSCSAFDQQWVGTAMPRTLNPAAPAAGKWEGSWQSDSTAYMGNLKAIIIPLNTTVVKDNVPAMQYRAELKMCLFDIITTEQAFTINATRGSDGKLHFDGKVDRGMYFGGIYHYDGYVDNDKFFCDYNSDRDCGTFKMHRLTQENQSQIQ